jgi:hypothetical protein
VVPALLILLNVTLLAACIYFAVKIMRYVLRQVFTRRNQVPKAEVSAAWESITIIRLQPPAQGKGLWLAEVSLLVAIIGLSIAYSLDLL